MKVVILAGGLGTRLSEYTDMIPKPMVTIGNHPLLWHLMQSFASHGYNEFVIAAGYKSQIIKQYFLNYRSLNSDLTIDLSTGEVLEQSDSHSDWKVTVVDTGENTMTGGRLKRLSKYIDNERFILTYGDGLSNVNINRLVQFHIDSQRLATVTAVHPVARFGELTLNDETVTSFAEKPQTSSGWINGGFFVMEPECLNYIENDKTVLEKYPLSKLAEEGNLGAFRHDGFWQCMDTRRDRDSLEESWISGNAPWKT